MRANPMGRPAPSLRARSTPSMPTGRPAPPHGAHRAYRTRQCAAANRFSRCQAWPGSASCQRATGLPPPAELAFAASRGRRGGLLPTNQRMNEYQPSAYCRFSAPWHLIQSTDEAGTQRTAGLKRRDGMPLAARHQPCIRGVNKSVSISHGWSGTPGFAPRNQCASGGTVPVPGQRGESA
ncbi:hypothetical protein RALTA_B0016 [Cupriavidus taiwanensis LMG 19424]|uniref:Uncharacterized protein n=1 Tax=Cupriavidus taiwanensis (strain DSM 17343 / BCRC 17206 / CCUG 44338 / CIP 107171 / LMG 19424 / R1) TaxID=977880 RepID=B2AHH2_CUPTR|nr:hypothetical protein RALTA_B0016 [Cupriavidus taiwanensis LMG 19424]